MPFKYNLILGPIVGGLSDTGANLWGRADGPGTLYAWIGKKKDLSDATLVGHSLTLRAEDGFAGVVPVNGLKPLTTYYYALTLRNAPPRNQLEYPTFTTFPVPGKEEPFKFVLGSCFRPDPASSNPIFDTIDARRKAEDYRFILMIGDQVYTDEWKHNGIDKVAVSVEDYREVYARGWKFEPLRRMLASLPAFMTLDDHEVDNDWHWTNSRREKASIPLYEVLRRLLAGRPREECRLPRQTVLNALQVYWEHQGMHGPRPEQAPRLNPRGQYDLDRHAPGSLAYTFTYGTAAFIVLDTRTMRVRNLFEHRMLGDGQWDLLKEWLLDVKDKYPLKFIVTSSTILFNMWTDMLGDRWQGFPGERKEMFEFLGRNDIRGVTFLAGDLHSGHAVRAEVGPRGQSVPVWEFCASPFQQKCNVNANWMYFPILGSMIRKQKKIFTAKKWNYGVIEVSYPQPGQPHVTFTLYDSEGEPFHDPVGD
jgi:phosphodiesterase/alkaline phosphatase D-like protein